MKKNKWVTNIIFIIGFLLCFSPIVMSLVQQWHQNDAIATYQKAASQVSAENQSTNIEEAQNYNDLLFQCQGAIVDNVDLLNSDSYNSILNESGTGIMGSLEIPKISVNLPIYHGTSDEVLSTGVGHVEGTSLPIGGTNTHSVLSGHRGLPNSKLLVRLDEVKDGDYFFIRTCNETKAYKVNDIRIVEPEDVSAFEITPGKDLVTLSTCTPYGINSHRLLVTGERVDYKESTYKNISKTLPSFRELLFTVLPLVFVIIMILDKVKEKRRLKKNDKEEISQ